MKLAPELGQRVQEVARERQLLFISGLGLRAGERDRERGREREREAQRGKKKTEPQTISPSPLHPTPLMLGIFGLREVCRLGERLQKAARERQRLFVSGLFRYDRVDQSKRGLPNGRFGVQLC